MSQWKVAPVVDGFFEMLCSLVFSGISNTVCPTFPGDFSEEYGYGSNWVPQLPSGKLAVGP